MVPEQRVEDLLLHGLQAGLRAEDDQGDEVRPPHRVLHQDDLLPEDHLQASSGLRGLRAELRLC